MSTARTVAAYLAEQSSERRKSLAAVRRMLKIHMPKGYKEVMRWGMITWEIPLSTYPDTHNGQPLCYAALAAQKNHLSLYLMGPQMYPDQAAAIKAAFKGAGKRLDMGKSCIRFKAADAIPLPAIGEIVSRIPPTRYIVRYEELIRR